MGTLFLTKEARIYSGTKIASSISGAGKTAQLFVMDREACHAVIHGVAKSRTRPSN